MAWVPNPLCQAINKKKEGEERHPPATWLYILIGTFITRLTLFALLRPEGEDPALHVPTTSSYENANDLPRNVGGRLSGSVIEYVSKQKKQVLLGWWV